jgi:hypothetical protein
MPPKRRSQSPASNPGNGSKEAEVKRAQQQLVEAQTVFCLADPWVEDSSARRARGVDSRCVRAGGAAAARLAASTGPLGGAVQQASVVPAAVRGSSRVHQVGAASEWTEARHTAELGTRAADAAIRMSQDQTLSEGVRQDALRQAVELVKASQAQVGRGRRFAMVVLALLVALGTVAAFVFQSPGVPTCVALPASVLPVPPIPPGAPPPHPLSVRLYRPLLVPCRLFCHVRSAAARSMCAVPRV